MAPISVKLFFDMLMGKYYLGLIVTGSIARSTTRRYLIYSEADFEVFRLAGATRCTDGGEILHGGGDLRAKFHPHRCNGKGI